MFLMGLSYMIFGTIISDGIPSGHTLRTAVIANANRDLGTKMVLGVQVGLIGLTMFVTQSSVWSLQAKQGLPLGNLVVGWGILGTYPSPPLPPLFVHY
jgi:phosphatidylinositol glycan class N